MPSQALALVCWPDHSITRYYGLGTIVINALRGVDCFWNAGVELSVFHVPCTGR
jgi:hypothetical protein